MKNTPGGRIVIPSRKSLRILIEMTDAGQAEIRGWKIYSSLEELALPPNVVMAQLANLVSGYLTAQAVSGESKISGIGETGGNEKE